MRIIIRPKLWLNQRLFATKSIPKDEIKYTNTINLPTTKFPARLSGAKRDEVQKSVNSTCLAGLYNWQREKFDTNDEFILHDGPPYANGNLHMGHAVNKILKDIALKNQIIRRRRVHYVPGWDCHGLPIELKALAKHDKKIELTPTKIRETARKFALETIKKQKQEFAEWGVTGDWEVSNSYYRTFDPGYIENQLRIFGDLYEKGLVYRDLKPVYWSPSSKTALAEAELEYDQNYESPSLYLKVKTDEFKNYKDLNALIWTTTPWTLPANQAICFNPTLKYSISRIKNELFIVATTLIEQLTNEFGTSIEKIEEFDGHLLRGLNYFHPIERNLKLPFLEGHHVQSDKGTGLVHTAPAHGPDDFLVFLEHKMPIRSLIMENGCYNDQSPEFLKGVYALKDGNKLVLQNVEKEIVHVDKIIHSYPIDWRTKKPVMFRASDQWFIDTNRLKDSSIKSIENVEIFPQTSSQTSKTVLQTQLQKRPYWCISRQRAWGVPIPVFYNKKSKQPIVDNRIIENIIKMLKKEKTIDFWWYCPIDKMIPGDVLDDLQLGLEDVERGKDILDIWFDSGVSWSAVLPKNKIADLYLEGLDQFTGWFQSSLLTSIAVRNVAPYKSIFVHGFAVDENGMKMSKSQGNVISPIEIVKKYGCDSLRWWVSAHATQHISIPVSHKLLSASAENVQKIRSVFKYMLGVIGKKSDTNSNQISETLNHLDQYFLHNLKNYHDEIFQLYDQYRYHRAAINILTFISIKLSGFYLHLIKHRLYCGTNEEHLALKCILEKSFATVCKTLWPILPFLVEESWSYYDNKPFYFDSVNIDDDLNNKNAFNVVEKAIELKALINKEHSGINTWNLDVEVATNGLNLDILKSLHPTTDSPVSDSELCEILQVGSLNLSESSLKNSQNFLINVKVDDKKLCSRCRRFSVLNSDICLRCEKVLNEKLK